MRSTEAIRRAGCLLPQRAGGGPPPPAASPFPRVAAMYSADPTFLRELRHLDPNLGCRYEPEHGHFVITYRRAVGEPVPVLTVEDEGGGFRRPDMRDIRRLQDGDLHRVPIRDRLRQVAKYMEEDREYRARKRSEMIRDMTRDDRIQLARAIGKIAHNHGGKCMPFRRIALRPRGIVFPSAGPA